MPICRPCRQPHPPGACDDARRELRGAARGCTCQHRPLGEAPAGQPSPGPECEVPADR